MRHMFISVFAVALVALFAIGSPLASASSSATPASLLGTLCTGPNGGIIPQFSIFGNNIGPEQQLLALSASILSVMFVVVALLYAIGKSFGFGRVVQTARTEIGEIVITVIVVIIFVGSFSFASTASGTNSLFTAPQGSANNNIFVADCQYLLSTVQNNLIAPYWVLNIDQTALSIIQSMTVNLFVNDWGFSFQPFAGLSVVASALSILMGITSAFILLMIGVSVLLGLLYVLMPLFLYAGIVLRSMPWTRAAGGAFLGMFAALYIMFPFLLYSMLSIYPPGTLQPICPLQPGQTSTSCSSIYQNYDINGLLNSVQQGSSANNPVTSGALTGVIQFFTNLGYGMITGFITAVVDPVLYMLFAVVISLFISFDFMEGMGDLLGAPALESGNVLRKVI